MRTGFIAGSFDLGPHAGHLATFNFAKAHCDHLIVGLHIDPSIERPEKNKPVEPVHQRWLKLQSCVQVDTIVPYATEADLEELLKLMRPHVRILGADYVDKRCTGDQIDGIKILYAPRDHAISSSTIRKKAGM